MRESIYRLPDGRHLTWYETGQGRPLVMLHGWSMSAAVFSELAALLAADFRLLVPDLPGHGKSAPVIENGFDVIAEDLCDWLAAVEDQPLAVVGWSLGGMLSLQMAALERVLIDRLVLIGTTPRFTNNEEWQNGLPATQVQALARNLRRRFEATLGEFFTLAFAGENISGERLRAIKNFAVRQSPVPDIEVALSFLELLRTQDQRHILPRVSAPSLVIHGVADQIAPIAAGRFLAAALPQGRLVELQGIGHSPLLSCPEVVAAEIRGFC